MSGNLAPIGATVVNHGRKPVVAVTDAPSPDRGER